MSGDQMQSEAWQLEEMEVKEDLTNEYEIEQKLMVRMQLEDQFRSGVNWFYWIAGLSIINSVLYLIGHEWGFVAGLGVTQIIDIITYSWYGSFRLVAIGINFMLAGVFALLGYAARSGRNWVIIVGAVLYALDAIVFIFIQDWISIAFHGLAIYAFIKAIKANNQLKKLGE
ncbi:hypothetical protein [Cellulosilyticum sp. I15G10I2]|uniref:hypothetical protein n=1 Tax=Cellulosilyticum sp. I15G10I2 TaxID=1892843 RepID=UPI00085BF5F0|nr:hypothetical protein [Cellulosilyticum sp. I15G10I2]